MAHYTYTAISRTGSRLAGEMEAVTRQSVVEALHKLGHLPVDVVEAGSSARASGQGGSSLFGGKPSAHQITLFTRELAILLKAGLPLDQSLALLENDAGSKRLQRMIGSIAEHIKNGKSLHEALGAQKDAFPPVYANMVRVAEASGTLDTVLARIAQTREKTEKLRSKALSQVLYPSMLIVMAIAAVTIMLTFVVPRFKDMIDHAGGHEMPDQARMVIAASDWLLANGHILALSVAGVILAAVLMWQRGWGRRTIESLFLRMPLIGHIMRLNLTVRFCRTLGVLLENGVELHAAMKLVRDVIGNEVAANVLDQSYDALRKGRSFLEPLSKSNLFPPVVLSMLRVGEETGSLTSACFHMADMFEDKMETAVQRTFTVLEPVVILFVSVFIGGIIISIFGAVISMNDLAM